MYSKISGSEPKQKGVSTSVFVGAIILTALAAFVFGVGYRGSDQFSVFNQGSQNGNLPSDLNYSSVEEVYDQLRKTYDGELTEEELLNGIKTGLTSATGDPYTTFLSEKDAKEFDESLNGEFEGIGAEIAVKAEQLQVVAPLSGTPADEAGLRPSDAIMQIDGEDTFGMSVEEAVSKIRGKAGSKVVLTIVRGDKDPQKVSITRGKISVDDATSKVLDNNIGYIELRTFGDQSASQVQKIAQDFKSKGIKKVILDLRNNSGGLLDASVDIAGVWLDGQVVVEEKADGVTTETLRADRNGVLEGTELIILTNGGSASASEIVAGALQDHGVATIVGEKSYGKGSVQTLEKLPSGGVLKVTVAKWYTPKGTNINKSGIKPDKEVKLTDKDFDKDRDPQLDAAIKLLQ